MEEVYRQYARTVYRYLVSLCHDPDLAEELTQETFCQAIRSVGSYDGRCKMSTWLCGVAKNVLRTHLRKHPPAEPLEDAPLAVPSAEAETISGEERLGLMRRLHALPEPCREVVYLRIFGSLSFREIGEVLDRTENWARVTFYRAKEKLKDTE
jgi:RNA polymerase sigma-70 factor (ECF subfamily)